jgi:hypothetical protein
MSMGDQLRMHIETAWYEDGRIEQRTVDLRGEIVMQFFNTKEAHIRKALIALGWTPPPHNEGGLDVGQALHRRPQQPSRSGPRSRG